MKIKKCPFCGSEIKDAFPSLYEMKERQWLLSHYCKGGIPLSVVIDVYGETKEEVVERWNGRCR